MARLYTAAATFLMLTTLQNEGLGPIETSISRLVVQAFLIVFHAVPEYKRCSCVNNALFASRPSLPSFECCNTTSPGHA